MTGAGKGLAGRNGMGSEGWLTADGGQRASFYAQRCVSGEEVAERGAGKSARAPGG